VRGDSNRRAIVVRSDSDEEVRNEGVARVFRGGAPGTRMLMKTWKPRSTISQLDDNIRRHHRRFYGFYVVEFSSRVTGAARAHR